MQVINLENKIETLLNNSHKKLRSSVKLQPWFEKI